MDSPEWDSVLQFVSDPVEGTSPAPEKRVLERSAVPTTPSQVPTPPVSQGPNSRLPSKSPLTTPIPHCDHAFETPPPKDSSKGTPTELVPDLSSIVSVSTTFFPGANLNPLPPDLIFLSSDAVFFYVHSHQVLGASDNGFRGLLPAKPQSHKSNSALKALGLSDDLGPIIPVPEPATVLNVVLHTIYAHSCAHYSPALDTLCAAVDALHRYGVPLSRHCAPGTPLYALLLAHAPIAPIEVYSLAAHYDLYELAVPVSSHMLGFQLATLTDEDAERMGSTYLKRLFFLHLGRIDALKRLLLPPPHLHAPTPGCDFVEQKKLTRAWALASAYLAWDARPDLSTGTMESALCPLGEHLSCDICQKALRERIQQLIMQWSVVKRTI